MRLAGLDFRRITANAEFTAIKLCVGEPESRHFLPQPAIARIGGADIAYYRLYFRDAAGRFLRVQELETDSDDDAFEAARALDHAYSIEIWQQGRQVGIVYPKTLPEPGEA